MASVAPAIPTAPWCNEAYDNAPCVFMSFGECVSKDTKGKRISDGDFAYTKCPSGDPPAFMRRSMVCGRRANEPVVPTRSRNMSGNATCDRIATEWANVLHEERACTSDADCTVVTGDGGCQNVAIAKSALKRKALQTAPCGAPGSGACAGAPAVRCVQGCCALSNGSWGTGEVAYPKPALP